VDLVGLVTAGNLVAKPLDLRPVGDIDDVCRDAQPLRQPRRLAQPLRFRQAGRRDVARCDIAGFRHQLADELAAHAAAAAGDYRDPSSEFGHVYLRCFLAPIQMGPPRLPLRRWGRAVRGAMSGRQVPADLARQLLEEIDSRRLGTSEISTGGGGGKLESVSFAPFDDPYHPLGRNCAVCVWAPALYRAAISAEPQ